MVFLMSGRPWTHKEIDFAVARCGKGLTYRQIGVMLGRTAKAVQEAMGRVGTHNPGSPHRPRSERFWAYIDAINERPMKRRELAERMGVTESAVRQYKKHLRRKGFKV